MGWMVVSQSVESLVTSHYQQQRRGHLTWVCSLILTASHHHHIYHFGHIYITLFTYISHWSHIYHIGHIYIKHNYHMTSHHHHIYHIDHIYITRIHHITSHKITTTYITLIIYLKTSFFSKRQHETRFSSSSRQEMLNLNRKLFQTHVLDVNCI